MDAAIDDDRMNSKPLTSAIRSRRRRVPTSRVSVLIAYAICAVAICSSTTNTIFVSGTDVTDDNGMIHQHSPLSNSGREDGSSSSQSLVKGQEDTLAAESPARLPKEKMKGGIDA